jgi:hypothetical protein
VTPAAVLAHAPTVLTAAQRRRSLDYGSIFAAQRVDEEAAD